MNAHGLEFVVPDEMISVAVAALEKSNLRPCPGPWTCIVTGNHTPSPPPAFHMHIGLTNVYVSIRAHSGTLGFAPPPTDLDFEAELHGMPDAHYTLASNRSLLARPLRSLGRVRGQGAFSRKGPPVRVPLSHVMLEAYIRLASAHRYEYGSFYRSMMTYVQEHVDQDGLLDDTKLSGPCRTFWLGLKAGRRRVRDLVDEFQLALSDADADADADADSGLGISSEAFDGEGSIDGVFQ
ncbi:hypothetical protein SLS62_009547 [Diatrype stigma]|uniref:Uncharacterized protein n=1 Tax=Diatrype stigma TaxID=117547 RepID=A0AAN9YKF1_9PEZI